MVQLLNIVSDLLIPLFLYPGLAFTLGLAWAWNLVEARLGARLYGGHAPKPFQQVDDFLKLAGKEFRPPRGSSRALVVFLSIVSLASPLFVLAILPVPGNSAQVLPGDVIAAFYLLEVPTFAYIVLGYSLASPYARLAAARQITLAIAYNVPVFVAIIALAAQARSFVIGDLSLWPTEPWAIAARLLAALAFFSCLPVKFRTGPFAVVEAPEELVAGALTDLSGALLAVLKMARAFTRIGTVSLFVLIFVPLFQLTLAFNILIYLGAILAVAALLSLLDSLFARLRAEQILSFYLWGRGFAPSPTVVALVALLLTSLSSFVKLAR